MSRAETARRFCSPGARPDAVSVLQRPSRPLTDDGKLATAVRKTGNMFAPRSRRSARRPSRASPSPSSSTSAGSRSPTSPCSRAPRPPVPGARRAPPVRPSRGS